jgi:hypothetical protein
MSDSTDFLRDVLGDPIAELNVDELYTPCVLRRMARMAQQPAAIARTQERQRRELAREIVRALRDRDEPRARELIEEVGAVFSPDALAAEVERLAREDALTAETDPWASGPESEPSYDERWSDDPR